MLQHLRNLVFGEQKLPARPPPDPQAEIAALSASMKVVTAGTYANILSSCAELKSQGGKQGELAEITESMAEAIHALTYNEFRTLVGVLTLSRENGGFNLRGDRVIKATESVELKKVIDGLKKAIKKKPESEPKELVKQAIYLTRACYPLGVNILNDNLDPSRPVAIDQGADKVIVFFRKNKIQVRGDGYLKLEKEADGHYSVSFAPVIGDKKLSKTVPLREGEGMLFGQPFSNSSIFGNKLGLVTEKGCFVSDTSLSRCGMGIVLNEGRLYFFDRGLRTSNAEIFEQRGGRSFSQMALYLPNEIRQDDFRFGATVVGNSQSELPQSIVESLGS